MVGGQCHAEEVPVIMISTMSKGVNTAWPVMIRPKARKQHLNDFLGE